MKNNRIVDAWDKIEPDSAAETRILGAIRARNHSGQSEKEKAFTMNKIFNRQRLAPIAACLVLIGALVVVIGNNADRFSGGVYMADLDGGTLHFYQSDALGVASFAFGADVTSRDLTADENKILFGDLAAVSYGTFDAENKSLLRVEGKTGNTKVLFAASGIPVTDTVIDVGKEISEIDGVSVSAGYFVTKENSRGGKNIIYFASFLLDGVSVCAELGGEETESETYRMEIASVIEKLIRNGAPDLNRIAE
jgi:hypothetical protein